MRITILSLLYLFTLYTFIIKAQVPIAEVEKYQTDITIDNMKLAKQTFCEIRINHRDGDRYTNVTIPYSKLNKLTKIEAYIKDKSGNLIKKLNSSDITERSSFADYSFYEDYMVKEFTLKHNTYPYILCYSYLEQEKEFLGIDQWCPVVDWEIPTYHATLTVNLPANYPIHARNALTSKAKVDTIKGGIRYNWQAKYTPIDKPEKFMPDVKKYFPLVEIVPENFKYAMTGSFKDWQTYGNWEYSLIENLSELPLAEKEKIESLTAGIDSKKEIIRRLYHYLQDETRYVNISIKTGGMKPFPASSVAEKKYGDCKALANYMKAMLNHLGISSCYTNVYAGDVVRSIDKAFPSQQFNHVILSIPLEKDTIWLDCTSDGPINYLGTFTQNRDAFLIEKNNSHFSKTPALKPEEVIDTRKVTFSQNSLDEVVAEFENTYRSDDFMYLFTISKKLNESMKSQQIHENFIETGFNPIDFKIVPSPRDSAFIRLKYTATTNRIFNQYGNEKIIRLLEFDIPDFSKPALRKYPVQLDFPICKSDTLDYSLPAGTKVTNLPSNKNFESKFGKYSIRFLPKDAKLRVIKHFSLHAATYTPDEFPEFYDFIKKITDQEKSTVFIITKSL